MTSIAQNGVSSNEMSGAVAQPRPSRVIPRWPTSTTRRFPRRTRRVNDPSSDDSDFEGSDIDEGEIWRRQQQERGEAEVNADTYPTEDDSETDDESHPLWVKINGEWRDLNTEPFGPDDGELYVLPDSVG
jgi:hypothetical protein